MGVELFLRVQNVLRQSAVRDGRKENRHGHDVSVRVSVLARLRVHFDAHSVHNCVPLRKIQVPLLESRLYDGHRHDGTAYRRFASVRNPYG